MTKDIELKISKAPPSINSLPAERETGIRIIPTTPRFQFVLIPHTEPCFLERDRYSDYPNYPETLLHVCSRWRQIALTSPTLWSRIDIVLSNPAGQKVLERAKIFLERAGQSSLDLRIFDQPIRSRRSFFSRSNDEFSNEECDDSEFEEDGLDNSEDGSDDPDDSEDRSDDSDGSSVSDYSNPPSKSNVLDFVPSFPARVLIRSIEVVISSARRCGSCYTPVLDRCFENRLPGTLTKLVLRVETEGGGIRPPWEINAFKGLTDLRLSGSGFDSIPESQFVNILRSSPRLQILQFSIKIQAPSPLNAPLEPIHLGDLGVLDMIENHRNGAAFETITRWIALGQKPLRLFLWCPLGSDSVKNFFRRANVTELHVRLHGNSTESLRNLIDLSPRLRVLAVDGCGDQFNPKSASNSSNPSHPVAQIDTLHLKYCGAQISSLQQMVQTQSIHFKAERVQAD
ncbi:hypothetical protein RSAG8_02916, partial [Rhizoctonia solani AG-8 WAC10335]